MGTKCPYCGSRNTSNILYGMPAFSDKLQKDLDSGKVILGGCCISDYDPAKHCNECRKDFAYPAIVVLEKGGSVVAYRDVVKSVKFSVWSFFEDSEVITITKNADGATVHVEWVLSVKTDPVEDRQLTEKEWYDFLDDLYSKIYLHEWKKSYKPKGGLVMDGTSWELNIKMEGNHKRNYKGDNEYPPYWDNLQRLLKKYGW